MTSTRPICVLLVALCLLAPAVEARRPGPLGRRIRPTPEELTPLPSNLIFVPPPERSSVEAVGPVIAAAPPGTTAEPPETFQPEGDSRAACGTLTEINIRPLRVQWNSGNGYCGEMSLQMSAMTRGIYISQKRSRALGVASNADHPDLLFDERVQPINGMTGIYGVAKMLGLDQPPESYWYGGTLNGAPDNQTITGGTLSPPASSFVAWVKANVLAGRPVIGGFRVAGGGYQDYDHIMPIFGVCYNSPNGLSSSDTFKLTDNYYKELTHSPTDSNFYAGYRRCGYTGCIPNDFYDYGVAVGPLRVPAGLYYPAKLEITSWSENIDARYEPGERLAVSPATARYTLAVSGLMVGRKYTIYRTTGLFAGFTIPQSAAALKAVCAAQGAADCRAVTFTAGAASSVFTHESVGAEGVALGEFGASSITYFLVVAA